MIGTLAGALVAGMLFALFALLRPRSACDGNCSACLRGCANQDGGEGHD